MVITVHFTIVLLKMFMVHRNQAPFLGGAIIAMPSSFTTTKTPNLYGLGRIA